MQSGKPQQSVAIIGGGPAGLMAAEVVAQAGYSVTLFDAMPSVGRKFLLAGIGGMNITHAEPTEQFNFRFGDSQEFLQPHLNNFHASALREWVHGLGIETFVGSSNRVFPTDMKAAPLLRAWLHRLREFGVKIVPRHKFIGWDSAGQLLLEFKQNNEVIIKEFFSDAVVFACGGASWPKLGSNGAWVPLFENKQIDIKPLVPSNCGFDVSWSERIVSDYAGAQLSSVQLSVCDIDNKIQSVRGEAVVTNYGIEGTSIYALSRFLRNKISAQGTVELHIDLLPDSPIEKIMSALNKPRGKNSMSNFLRKQLNLSPLKIALLREIVSKVDMDAPQKLASAIKCCSITLTAARTIDEAISTAGGVAFSELDDSLMLKKIPGVFCAGEMLDWEAPTGGYLLTACFATGRAAGNGVIKYLSQSHHE